MPPHPGQKFASSGNKDNFLTHSLHSAFGRVLSLLPHPGHGSGRHIFCRCRRISIYQCPGRPRGQSCGQIIGLRLGRVQSYTLPRRSFSEDGSLGSPRFTRNLAARSSPRVKLRFLLFTLLSSRSKRFAVRAPASQRVHSNTPLAPKGSPSVRQPANVCIQTILSLQKVRRPCASQPKAVRGGQPRG